MMPLLILMLLMAGIFVSTNYFLFMIPFVEEMRNYYIWHSVFEVAIKS